MPAFDWSDAYETGIPGIDSDHRELFSLINGLYDSHKSGSAQNDIEEAMASLLAYIDRHFEREESLLSAVGYGDLEAHAAAHKLLGERMNAYADLYKSEPAAADAFDMDDFVDFLLNWLKGHILNEDMAYLPSVKSFVKWL